MAYKRCESVLVVIVNEDEQVLMLQRNDDPAFWQSVTGTMEVGEVPIQTAYREVQEETGIVLDSKHMQIQDCRTVNQYRIRDEWLYRYPPGSLYNNEYVFRVTVPTDCEIVLTEHSAYEWLDKKSAMRKVWSKTNHDAIARFVVGNT